MKNMLTAENILKAIDSKVNKGSSYMDAILDYADKNGLEVESIGEVIKKSPILKEKIKSEANILSMLKPTE